MNLLLDNRGMTLIEVLVSGVLSAVMGFIIFTVLGMFGSQSGQSMSTFIMNQQYDNVAAQIARDTRRAKFVFTENETPLAHGATADTVQSIFMCDAAGTVIAQYKIENGVLLEGAQSKAYAAGSGSVRVVAASSYFVLAPQRKNVALHLSLCKTDRNVLRNISPRKDVFICRN